MKILKQKKLEEEKLKESKSKHSAFNHNKGFTIGPYTDAGALKEIQKFVNEKFTEEDDDEEEGIVNDEGFEGDEEMTPEQLAELENLQKMQMGQYQANDNDENNARFNNQELEDNNYENYYQQQEGDEENNTH